MSENPEIKVLVVEDDPNWRDALCGMYERIFATLSPVVETASSGQDALRLMRNRQFHLLSCDINLQASHPTNENGSPNLNIPGADGRAVLRMASETKACNGVVIITGIDHDEKLSVVIRDEVELKRLRMTLDTYLEGLFPGKKLCLKKQPDMSVEQSIQVFEQNLEFEKLLELCDGYNTFRLIGEKWMITFNGTTKFYNDINGMHFIAFLMSCAGKEIHCIEIEKATNKLSAQADVLHSNMSSEQLEKEGLRVSGSDDLGNLPEGSDVVGYKSNIKDIDSALRTSDIKEALRCELNAIRKELAEENAIALQLPCRYQLVTKENFLQCISIAIFGAQKTPKERKSAWKEVAKASGDLSEGDIEEWHTMRSILQLTQKRIKLQKEVSRACGLGGRKRKDPKSPDEMSRQRVQPRIKDALKKIKEKQPDLYAHLKRTISTGVYCSYIPTEPVFWSF